MKRYVVLTGLFLHSVFSNAQYSLVFCEDVSTDGKPMMVSNQFMVDADGGVLKYLLRTDDKFNTDQLDFRVYYMNDAGAEEEIQRLPQQIEPEWTYAWKEMVMFDPGLYRVKIYTAKGTYLTSANLTIKHR